MLLCFVPDLSLNEGDAQCRKVFRTDHIEAEGLVLTCGLSEYLEFCREAVGRWRGIARDGDHRYAVNFGDLIVQLLEVGCALRPGLVRTIVNWNSDRHDVVRVIAERRVNYAKEAFDRCSRSGKHQQGDSDLSADQHIVGSAPAHAPGSLARVGLHDPAHFGPRELPGGP